MSKLEKPEVIGTTLNISESKKRENRAGVSFSW